MKNQSKFVRNSHSFAPPLPEMSFGHCNCRCLHRYFASAKCNSGMNRMWGGGGGGRIHNTHTFCRFKSGRLFEGGVYCKIT